MRVLHINGNYIYSSLHQQLIDNLNELGDQNTVFVPARNNAGEEIQVNGNVSIQNCFNKLDRFNFYSKQRKIIRKIEETYDVSKYDCIHGHTLFTDGNAAYVLSRKHQIPYIVTVRNTDINVFFKYLLHLRLRGKEILDNASNIIFISKPYKDIVVHKYASDEVSIDSKSVIIPNGIDPYWIKHLNSEKDRNESVARINQKRIRIIYAGDIDKNKNIVLTVKAKKILENQGWKIQISAIGKVKNEKIFKMMSSEVDFVDKLPKEQLIKSYRDADIFVMPSHRETFGLVYAEAMSQGLPVIYTRGQGFDGQFEDGLIGYSVDDKDASELARKLIMVSDQYGMLSTNCLQLCTKFDWQKISKEYNKVYRNALAGGTTL